MSNEQIINLGVSTANGQRVLKLAIGVDPIAMLSERNIYRDPKAYEYDREKVSSLAMRGFPCFVIGEEVYCYPKMTSVEYLKALEGKGWARIRDLTQLPPKAPVKTAGIQFLTGKDYPHVCNACKMAIDQCVELVREGEDTDDIEAPLNFAADHNMLCGGRHCLKRQQGETTVYCLRHMKPDAEGPIFSQPEVCRGTPNELHEIATKKGWKAVRDNTVFHYHYQDGQGNLYYLDLA